MVGKIKIGDRPAMELTRPIAYCSGGPWIVPAFSVTKARDPDTKLNYWIVNREEFAIAEKINVQVKVFDDRKLAQAFAAANRKNRKA